MCGFISAGEVLLVDKGEYDEYTVLGICVAQRSFVLWKPLKIYLHDRPKEKEKYFFDAESFLSFLIQKGHLKKISFTQLHLGNYGRVESVEARRWKE